MIEQRLGDENHSVRAAAIFALHRLGDYRHSGELAEMLLYHKDKQVRGNAAMLFGLLGEPKAIKLLKRAQKDPEYMVSWQALESQMLLGDSQALGRVGVQVNSGRQDISVLAMLALGRSREQKSAEVLRVRLNRQTDHIESRLSAARALGMLGYQDGLDLARRSLKYDTPDPDPRAGSPEDQIMRVRTMAALALGAMQARAALPELKQMMTDSEDSRIQVAAARAILEILTDRQETDAAQRPHGTSP
jgi:HEAT repeat protein